MVKLNIFYVGYLKVCQQFKKATSSSLILLYIIAILLEYISEKCSYTNAYIQKSILNFNGLFNEHCWVKNPHIWMSFNKFYVMR